MARSLGKYHFIIARIIVLVSGTLLLGTTILIVLTGLCLRNTEISNMLTWLGGYPGCSYLHIEFLPNFFIPLIAIHIVATAETLSIHLSRAERYYSLLGTIYRGFSWISALVILLLYMIAR